MKLAIAAILAAAALSGCDTTSTANAPAVATPAAALRTGTPADENTCLGAVGAQTKNTGVVLSSDASQAGTEIIIGVGPQQAKWRCLIARGVVSQVTSLTDEGRL